MDTGPDAYRPSVSASEGVTYGNEHGEFKSQIPLWKGKGLFRSAPPPCVFKGEVGRGLQVQNPSLALPLEEIRGGNKRQPPS